MSSALWGPIHVLEIAVRNALHDKLVERTSRGDWWARLHDARHSCATLMHMRGVPVAVIAARLGHQDAGFTLRTYAHSTDAALAEAAATLGAITSKPAK